MKKVVLVTGGDMGIGRESALGLARTGATVIITSRPPDDGEAARAAIAAASGNDDIHVVPLELGSFDSIRKAADEVLTKWDRLDVLVNNAGGFLTVRKETQEGHEVSFGVNYLGPFLLTRLLADRLAESAPSRVVNLSSSQHKQAGVFNFDDLDMRLTFDGVKAYNRSKLAVLLFTRELAKREAERGISVFAVQPGAVRSNFGRHGETEGVWNIMLKLLRPFMVSPTKGAGASLYCAMEPGIERLSGSYFQRGLQGNMGPVRTASPSRHAIDDEAAPRLWELSNRLTGL